MIFSLLYVIGLIFAYPAYFIYFKRKTYYLNKKLQSRHIKGGAILISNHKGFKDFMMYIYAFPFRKIYCLMSEKVFGISKVLNIFIKALGGILVDRRIHNFSFVDESVKLLNKNKLLVVFPEGKLPLTKFMGPFYPSYIMIALKSGKPIIPLYTPGGYSFFKRNKMVVGTPIYINDYIKNTNPTKEEIDYANNEIRNKVLELEKFYKYSLKRDKYHKKFSIKRLPYDLSRGIMLYIRLFVIPFKIYNKGYKKYKLKEKENLILISNHTSFNDPLLMYNLYWRRRINMIIADVVYNGHKIRGKLLNSIGGIKINRDKPSLEALKKCNDILEAGGVLSIFPEGHISRNEVLDKFEEGAAYFSIKNNTKILPIYIKKKRHFLGFHKLYLGEYIYPPKELTSESVKEYNEKIRDTILSLQKEYGC